MLPERTGIQRRRFAGPLLFQCLVGLLEGEPVAGRVDQVAPLAQVVDVRLVVLGALEVHQGFRAVTGAHEGKAQAAEQFGVLRVAAQGLAEFGFRGFVLALIEQAQALLASPPERVGEQPLLPLQVLPGVTSEAPVRITLEKGLPGLGSVVVDPPGSQVLELPLCRGIGRHRVSAQLGQQCQRCLVLPIGKQQIRQQLA